MKDFIITSLQSWDSAFGGNAKDIAIEMSKQHRVMYINTNPAKKTKRPVLRHFDPNLYVLDCDFTLFRINGLPDGILFDVANLYNNFKIFRLVNRCIAQLNFQNVILFCDNDIYRSFYARRFLKASLYIYYRRDNLHPVSYWARHIKRLEPAIIKKSDLVLANSSELAEYATPYRPLSCIYNIGQGVDQSAYQANIYYPLPEECKKLARPIIGYMGALSSLRLDIELLYYLATNRPQYSFLFVGKRDEIFMNHPLGTLPNVCFTGLKPMNEMPKYTEAMDVCLNPQLINDVTIGNYPRKVDEYLAMGKPVVATHTHTMEIFKDYVSLCTSHEEYLEAIDNAVNNISSEELRNNRISFAHTHSWAHCAEKIYKAIENYENSKSI